MRWEEGGGLQQYGGHCTAGWLHALGSIRTAGWHEDTLSPHQTRFLGESMRKSWGRERWHGEARGDGQCLEGTVLGKAMQRGSRASCLGRTWDWMGPQGSLLAILLLCVTNSLGKPLCRVTASRRGLGSPLAVFLLPLMGRTPLSASTLLGCSCLAAAAPRHVQEVPRAGQPPEHGASSSAPVSPHRRWAQVACAWLLPWVCRVVLCFWPHLLCKRQGGKGCKFSVKRYNSKS